MNRNTVLIPLFLFSMFAGFFAGRAYEIRVQAKIQQERWEARQKLTWKEKQILHWFEDGWQ